mmetsp:Transcript_34503/g.6216  ORF Transcript_34503/g.6216 Transcript_34503/m.6216 type:complete len:93 (-) Transcript_34503:1102-1380(-)
MFIIFLLFAALTENIGTKCDSDSDCKYLNSCEDDECVHKDLYPPDAVEIVGVFVVIVIAALANAGGIGGGALMVPILILIFFFDPHFAIPLS